MRIAVCCFLLIVSTGCLAADRTERVRALMEAQGLVQMFEQQLASGKAQGQQQAQQMLEQIMAQLNPTKEFEDRFSSALQGFMNEVSAPWTAQDIVDVWAKAYGGRFTDEELDQLVAYYTSPLGQKDVRASQEALPELTNHFSALSTPLLEQATGRYIQRIQLIAKECDCRR